MPEADVVAEADGSSAHSGEQQQAAGGVDEQQHRGNPGPADFERQDRDEQATGQTKEDHLHHEAQAAEAVQPRIAPLSAGEHEAQLGRGRVVTVETLDPVLERAAFGGGGSGAGRGGTRLAMSRYFAADRCGLSDAISASAWRDRPIVHRIESPVPGPSRQWPVRTVRGRCV